MYIIGFCPDIYFKELFPSLSQISYENTGGTCMDHGAKVADLERVSKCEAHWGWGTQGLEGESLDLKSPPPGN